MQPIESRQNGALRHLARLGREKKYRMTTGEMVCEGEKMLGEALESGARVTTVLVRAGTACDERLLVRAEAQGARLYTATESIFTLASDVQTPQGLVFSCARPPRAADALPRVKSAVLLDGLQDPGNLGTILRTADAFDCDGVFLVNACADPYSPKTARATMGAVFRRDVYQCTADELCALLQKSNLPLYGTALRNDTVSLRDAELSRAAVAIGSEGRGLSAEILSKCEKTIKIPMSPRCESLNAAVAASVVLWEMYR